MEMNFVLATDDNYWMQTYVAIYSLVYNNREHKLNVYILCENIDNKFKQGIKQLKGLNFHTEIIFVNVKKKLDELKDFKVKEHLTRGTYYRFFIQTFLPAELDRIIYLDGDIIVNGPLWNLYNVDFNGKLLAAVPQIKGKGPNRLGLPPESEYFNAGILVVNLDKWRKDNISEKLIKYSKENQDIILWPSQDPLNAVAHGQWIELSKKFNLYHGFIEDNSYLSENIKPIIIHYSGATKPWKDKDDHPYKKQYWSYLRKTPYRLYIPNDLIINTLRKCFRKV
jgi:lipopolysaccharide biosynthesis glycosyltransferase